ncbi:MAG: hypothetical protein ACM3US_03515 [Sphingomonadaceae bacterium]
MSVVVRLLLLSLSLAASLAVPSPLAQAEPLYPNNKVGINVIRHFDTRYLSAVSQVVNSSGGDWGYVSVLLLKEDWRDPARIQRFLDDANRLHLIPILRLSTRMDGAIWVKPEPNDPAEWKRFLTGLKWHTSPVYMTVGNEPNLGLEWGGQPNPREYARYLESFLDTFSDVRSSFRILNAPMDISNLTGPGMIDDFEFLAGMRAEVPDIFSRLDGWAANPYHFFEDRGIRYTYRGYAQELDFIGVNLPVFIIESYIGFVDDKDAIARYYQTAFDHWLKDPRVVAATPHFYNPEAKVFWMFDADDAGSAINLSPTARMLLRMPKTPGSPTFLSSLPHSTAMGSSNAILLVSGKLDYPIANGRFFTQANGSPLGKSPYGYSITDDAGVLLWSEFQRLGGVDVLGYPVSRRFFMDGFISQATQKFILQWRPERREVWFVNVFDVLADRKKDDWLLAFRQTPRHPGSAADAGLSWERIVERHWRILDGDPKIKARFEADPDPLAHYGLPISLQDMGNAVVLRAQRAVFQRWKEDVPWAKAGEITVANGGDIAKEAGLLPLDATVPESPPVATLPAGP